VQCGLRGRNLSGISRQTQGMVVLTLSRDMDVEKNEKHFRAASLEIRQ
jgi:hypothetical protein